MATLQNLKKKLQVIRSTQKISQAMKTVSTVKYAKLTGLYNDYAKYEKQCNRLYNGCRKEFNSVFSATDENAPVCYIVMSSNKGMCGSFNSEVLSFFRKILREEKEQPVVFVCGKQAKDFLDNKRIPYEKDYILGDVPAYSAAEQIFEDIRSFMKDGKISSVKIVYPEYVNMMRQAPVCHDLFSFEEGEASDIQPLFIPDKETVIKNSAEKILISILYKKILETALGAQAATLTTMRSAYDTACEYTAELETAINRLRQSRVTADVLEISAEYSMERNE